MHFTKATFLLLALLSLSRAAFSQLTNFDDRNRQTVRFDKLGSAVDAHDGEIAYFNGIYYLYGTSYDCGYQWGEKSAPFCGFKVYTSVNLTDWDDKGFLFNAATPVWQARCNGKTYGCYRPHVVYNKKTRLYVLWINVYDNVSGYRVFTSPQPAGPFTEVAEPKLAVNSNMPAAGLNNGDHDTFVDDDGTAYLAYTDWRAKGAIVIEKLNDDYLTGTGEYIASVTAGETEAPCLFKRSGRYYIVYSDPNCGYCSGTGSSYKSSSSPLGTWSAAASISNNSCGGQPSFVSVIKVNSETVYLYGSDLWNNAAKNEALANYFWAPLSFDSLGNINPVTCTGTYFFKEKQRPPPMASPLTTEGFNDKVYVSKDTQYVQTFTADKSGRLDSIAITFFQMNKPDSALVLELYRGDSINNLSSYSLFKTAVSSASTGWSPRRRVIMPGIYVKKGERYSLLLRTRAAAGSYGFAAGDAALYPGSKLLCFSQGQPCYTTSAGSLLISGIYPLKQPFSRRVFNKECLWEDLSPSGKTFVPARF